MSTSSWSSADIALLKETYELLCTSRMNVLYYEHRLGRVQTYSFWMEVVTAATASGSGLASLTLLATGPGIWIWQALAVVAAAVAVVRPIYAPGKRIESLTSQLHGYRANFFALRRLVTSIRQDGALTDETHRRYNTLFDRHVQLSAEDEASPDAASLARARKLCDVELPHDQFWWPEASSPPELHSARQLRAPTGDTLRPAEPMS